MILVSSSGASTIYLNSGHQQLLGVPFNSSEALSGTVSLCTCNIMSDGTLINEQAKKEVPSGLTSK